MATRIIATSSKTIIDLSDGKSLSVYLGSNHPKTQIKNTNVSPIEYTPNWSNSPLVITPVVYINQQPVSINDSRTTILWKRKEGNGIEARLSVNENVSGNVLTVNANKLDSANGNMITYIAEVSYYDSTTSSYVRATADITFAMVTSGVNAKTAWITGEQVFKISSSNSISPNRIQLTANVQNVTFVKWQYKYQNSGWLDYPRDSTNPTNTNTTINIYPNHDIFYNNVAIIRIVTSDNNITDSISIYKIQDGVSASVAFLTNESITFAANKDGQVAATSVYCNVAAYTGSSAVTPTIGMASGMPQGMTVTASSAVHNEIPLTIRITNNATLGGIGPQNGTVIIPVTSPVTTNLYLNWSKVNTGATGAAGLDGQNAIVFSLYAPHGTVFYNQTGVLEINTQAYDGANVITDAEYKWYIYKSGTWDEILNETNSYLNVDGKDVIGLSSFKCEMSYNDNVYTDIITLTDKTDNYQLEIDSSAGNVFKNNVGTTCLIARLWQSGKEIDAQKSTTYVRLDDEPLMAPSGTERYYYQIRSGTPETRLMRSYSNGMYVDVTNDEQYGHTKKYTWYRRDKNGEPMDDGRVFATGKVIYVRDSDVDVKTVFICDVE